MLRLLPWLLLLACANSRAACECLWQGSFSEVQSEASLVVSGTVLASKGNAVDLSIDRRLRGSEHLEEIRVWMKTGDYCRPEPELFAIGSQWVMALQEITSDIPGGFNPHTPNYSYGRIGDYYLSSCGGYWLSQSNDLVTGNLVNAPRWEREPKMTPVMLELVEAYVNGEVPANALLEASREDPALRELMLDTRAFLRGDED